MSSVATAEPAPEKKGMVFVAALSSLILSIGAFFFLLRAPFGVPALILGFLAFREINRSDGQIPGKWLAIIGMVLGLGGIILDIIFTISFFILQAKHVEDRQRSLNHLREIGAGVIRYEKFEKHYPIGTLFPPIELRNNLPWQQHPVSKRLSWMVSLLPYVSDPQQRAPRATTKPDPTFTTPTGRLYRRFDLLKPWNAPENQEAANERVRLYLCFGHPNYNASQLPPPTHYIGMAGLDPDAAALPTDHDRAGVFGFNRVVSQKDITAGTEYTTMAVETSWKNGPWAQGGFSTIRGADPNEQKPFGYNRPWGGCFPNGFHMLLLDGSARFYNNDFAAELFRRHATIGPDMLIE